MKKTPPKSTGASAKGTKGEPREGKDAGGRPTKYRAQYAEQVFKLCLLGATDKLMAEILGVTKSTFDLWKEKHRRFSDSITRGKAAADAEIANSLYHRAKGYSHKAVKIMQDKGKPVIVPYVEHYPPDTPAASLWLRNRHPALWRDKVEHVGGSLPGDEPVTVLVMDFEAKRRAAEAKLRQIIDGNSGAD